MDSAKTWIFGETGVFRERRGDAHMAGPRPAEGPQSAEFRILRGDWWLVGTVLFVELSGEARRSAPGASRAHPLLRSAGASLSALGGAFARQPHPVFFCIVTVMMSALKINASPLTWQYERRSLLAGAPYTHRRNCRNQCGR